MNIAEEIYLKAQQLPQDLAREVLDFIGYLEMKHGLSDKPVQNLERTAPANTEQAQENPNDAVWEELLFGQ